MRIGEYFLENGKKILIGWSYKIGSEKKHELNVRADEVLPDNYEMLSLIAIEEQKSLKKR